MPQLFINSIDWLSIIFEQICLISFISVCLPIYFIKTKPIVAIKSYIFFTQKPKNALYTQKKINYGLDKPAPLYWSSISTKPFWTVGIFYSTTKKNLPVEKKKIYIFRLNDQVEVLYKLDTDILPVELPKSHNTYDPSIARNLFINLIFTIKPKKETQLYTISVPAFAEIILEIEPASYVKDGKILYKAQSIYIPSQKIKERITEPKTYKFALKPNQNIKISRFFYDENDKEITRNCMIFSTVTCQYFDSIINGYAYTFKYEYYIFTRYPSPEIVKLLNSKAGNTYNDKLSPELVNKSLNYEINDFIYFNRSSWISEITLRFQQLTHEQLEKWVFSKPKDITKWTQHDLSCYFICDQVFMWFPSPLLSRLKAISKYDIFIIYPNEQKLIIIATRRWSDRIVHNNSYPSLFTQWNVQDATVIWPKERLSIYFKIVPLPTFK